jgi:hypothetical protein
MKTINDFKKTIKWELVEPDMTYIYANFEGVKYGQSYLNKTYTLQDMMDKFVAFYYPFYQDNYDANTE